MKRLLFLILTMGAAFASVDAQHLYGDVDHDGEITVADILILENIILEKQEAETIKIVDGQIDETWLPEKPNHHNRHEYVDLGLSVKWATCNVGASKPEDCGKYFAWGDTEQKIYYGWNTYDFWDGNPYEITKYCTDVRSGQVDGLSTLIIDEDDAAYANWGEGWRMPTSEETEELLTSCDVKYTKHDEVYGLEISGPSGNSIFIPTNGFFLDYHVGDNRTEGHYWTSSLDSYSNGTAQKLYFINNGDLDAYVTSGDRFLGYGVRPVLILQNEE